MAASAIPLRQDISGDLCWDLNPMFASPEEWESAFRELDRLLQTHQSYRGRLAESPETLRDALESGDALGLAEERLYVYAHLRNDENTADSVNAGRLDRIQAKGAEIGGLTAWFEPELMAIPKDRFDELRNDPVLAFYKRTLDETDRERPHTLSEPEERILGLSGEVFGVPEKSFSMLNDADLRFPKVRGDSGKLCELTHGTYRKFLESSRRPVRRAAFKACFSTYDSLKNTFATLLDGTVKGSVLNARLRHYSDSLEASLAGANIPRSVYTGLIDSVHRGLPALYRYFALRARVLGLKKIEMYDLHNPLVPAARMDVTWPDSIQLVREACRPLGAEYCAALDHAFTDRWIDVMECRSKRSGAYSSGCYGYPPYLLLNYSGTLDSVSTLAHELGHSMHSYFSDHTQKYHYASYHLFAAEIASTTNELLLHHSLMEKTADPSVRAYLLNHLLDEFRGTLYRQTMFAEFEQQIYAMAESDEPLTADALSDRYFRLNAQYHGPSVVNTDLIRYEWARIPHFHYCFYVYQYATGISAAAALSRDILAGRTDRYLEFLKAGDSRDVIDILKGAGVDFSTSAPVDAAVDLFDRTVSQLDALLKS